MIGKWFLIIETINKKGGYDVINERKYQDKEISNEHDATLCFNRKMTQYGENPSVDELRVSIVSPSGNIIKQEYIDNRTIEPQTEE